MGRRFSKLSHAIGFKKVNKNNHCTLNLFTLQKPLQTF